MALPVSVLWFGPLLGALSPGEQCCCLSKAEQAVSLAMLAESVWLACRITVFVAYLVRACGEVHRAAKVTLSTDYWMSSALASCQPCRDRGGKLSLGEIDRACLPAIRPSSVLGGSEACNR